jgi:hypothetical protein
MMTIFKNFVAGLVLAVVAFVPSIAQAQDQGSTTVGKATITVGSGMVLMMLPDAGSMLTEGPNNAVTDFPVREKFKFSDNFKETGLNFNASIAVPVSWMTLSLNGFWANIKGKESLSCTPQTGGLCAVMPLVDDPARMQVQGVIDGGGAFGGRLLADSKRDVDYWGVALEAKRTPAPNSHYLAWGLDVRGIYQDLNSTIVGTSPAGFVDTYKESLKTTYYGGYLAWCGNYSPPLLKNWGLESSFRLQGGVYYADTDYRGRLTNSGPIIGGGGDPTSRLSLSSRDMAFIGGLTLGIGKRLSTRTKLSLNGGYEYYSQVPRMIYNTADQNANPFLANRQFGTRIQKRDGSSIGIGLILSIEL